MKIAVLALQGDFAEHEKQFQLLECETLQLRQAADLQKDFDALILPGGESTVQGKLLRELGMFEPLKQMISDGLPVMATCAGTILLADKILDEPYCHLGVLKAAVRRNAYGRQLSSFYIRGNFAGMSNVNMSFIRAPQIEFCAPDVEVLSEHQGRITAVRQRNLLAMTFHPELTRDCRVAEYFLKMVADKG
jgi:5'-phosphate synthase pdxT subunit